MKEKTVCFTGHRDIPMLKKVQLQKDCGKHLLNLLKAAIAFLVQAVLWVLILSPHRLF